MDKRNYEFEFEINASPKLLYPYFSTAGGLEQWFADKVEIDADSVWNLVWDGEDHFAKISSQKILKSIKFEFLGENKKPVDDPATLEFGMLKNEMTETFYFHISEYLESDADDQDQSELWESIVEELKGIVGG